MSEEPKRYTAASLEDIAKAFDQFADDQDFCARYQKLKRDKLECCAKAAVWRDAAQTLRSTTIVQEAEP